MRNLRELFEHLREKDSFIYSQRSEFTRFVELFIRRVMWVVYVLATLDAARQGDPIYLLVMLWTSNLIEAGLLTIAEVLTEEVISFAGISAINTLIVITACATHCWILLFLVVCVNSSMGVLLDCGYTIRLGLAGGPTGGWWTAGALTALMLIFHALAA